MNACRKIKNTTFEKIPCEESDSVFSSLATFLACWRRYISSSSFRFCFFLAFLDNLAGFTALQIDSELLLFELFTFFHSEELRLCLATHSLSSHFEKQATASNEGLLVEAHREDECRQLEKLLVPECGFLRAQMERWACDGRNGSCL